MVFPKAGESIWVIPGALQTSSPGFKIVCPFPKTNFHLPNFYKCTLLLVGVYAYVSALETSSQVLSVFLSFSCYFVENKKYLFNYFYVIL